MQIGFASLLAIAFIVLKLTGFIAWSWIWVLAPLWIGLVVWITIMIIMIWLASGANYKLNIKKKNDSK